MRSIWKGSISFGLVSVPVKVFAATENHSVSFHQVHIPDGGRIRYRKVCQLDEEEAPREEIGRGFQTEDGSTVLITDEDLAALPLPTAKTVEILAFVPEEDIDPIQLDRSYYLAADGQRAAKPYVLLREALTRSGKVAVAKLAMRGRESLGMLRVYADTLALHTMLWPDEIRSAEGMAPEERVTVRDAELDLADTLMETLGELDWGELRDEYREALEQLVAAKAEGVEPGEAETAPAAGRGKGQVVDLMAVLRSSVDEAREARGEDATVHELSDRRGRSAGGKTEPKKSAKASGKKATKKSATKRSTKKTAGTSGRKTGEKAAAQKTGTAKTGAKKSASAKKTGTGGTAGKKSAARKTAAKRPARKAG
ncbi:Ku protein [Streptomyces sp. AJS327]|uniref:non-homologous end joining protein Ku n=1 Tax=Streptomyces sp. AJS327 TaxID=2545265 RepID=UPI0015DD7327|nr:Ku protein [Streptomyces sp. AJS327]MBA0049965.1 Ku protein [Streptomyces sp. AJS327]